MQHAQAPAAARAAVEVMVAGVAAEITAGDPPAAPASGRRTCGNNCSYARESNCPPSLLVSQQRLTVSCADKDVGWSSMT
jgi:hypothetical protein